MAKTPRLGRRETRLAEALAIIAAWNDDHELPTLADMTEQVADPSDVRRRVNALIHRRFVTNESDNRAWYALSVTDAGRAELARRAEET